MRKKRNERATAPTAVQIPAERADASVVLDVEGLCAGFETKYGYIPAIDEVSFKVMEGEAVAIVGESGCGKTVTALSILRLLDEESAKESARVLTLDGVDLLSLSEKEMNRVRGAKGAMVFQEPMTSLNPLKCVGDQIVEALLLHTTLNKKQAKDKAVALLSEVGIADAERRAGDYPHMLSGGQRQRVMIAMALSCNPRLLIADEPTTALDVTVQAQVLELIAKLRAERSMALLLITHNLGVVAEIADRIIIMYAGQIVEDCSADELFDSPAHPYCSGLLKAVPDLKNAAQKLYVIEGTVPNPLFYSKACRFNPRCEHCTERCKKEAPTLTELSAGHFVRCFHPLNQNTEARNEQQ